MTKINIFLKSVLFYSLIISGNAHAQSSSVSVSGIDQVLVAYFEALYKNSALQCSITQNQKSQYVAEIEPSCLIRKTAADGSKFIGAYKQGCNQVIAKAQIDSRIKVHCDKIAADAKAKQEALAKTNKAIEESNAKAAANAPQKKDAVDSASDAYKEYKNLEKKQDKYSGQADKYYKDGELTEKGQEKLAGVKEGFGKAVDTVKEGAGKVVGAVSNGVSNLGGQQVQVLTEEEIYASNPEMEKRYQALEARNDELNKKAGQIDRTNPEEVKKFNAEREALAKEREQLRNDRANEMQSDLDKEKAAEKAEVDRMSPQEKKDREDSIAGEEADKRGKTEDSVTQQENQQDQADANKVEQQGTQEGTQSKSTAANSQQNCEQELQKLENDWRNFAQKRFLCSKSANTAENFCEKLRSPMVQNVQKYMSLGAAALSKVTAASESCDKTSKISKVAQTGILSAQLFCTTLKFTCDTSCEAAKNALETAKTSNTNFKNCAKTKVNSDKIMHQSQKSAYEAQNGVCPGCCGCQSGNIANEERIIQGEEQHIQAVDQSSSGYDKLIQQEEQQATVTPETDEKGNVTTMKVTGGSDLSNSTERCKKKHSADIVAMGMQALALYSAHKDGKKCREQLASGGGQSTQSAVATATLSTAEFCAIPANASSSTCKCSSDPNAEGCLGAIAKQGLSASKIGTGGGASAFAGPGGGAGDSSLTANATFGSGSGSDGAASGTAGAAADLGSGGGFAGTSSSGGGGGGFSGGGASAGDLNSPNATAPEEKKSKFGFFSSIGSLFGGGSGAKKGGAPAISAAKKFELEQAVKRKLASEQVRAEVSTASGKSNFDKIKSRYRSNSNSFEQ